MGAGSHFRHDVCDSLLGFLVDIGTNCGPERIYDVDEEEHQEEVQQELGVEGKDMGKVGVLFDEAEQ